MKTNQIIYKLVKFQFAFFITESPDKTTVKMKQLTTLPSQKEFKTYNEARKFIRKLKEIL